jgi:prepilin-type N-terminal cleavage/methylation domain-containing protein/prepilin-type processing-associated H-X9-DG protein
MLSTGSSPWQAGPERRWPRYRKRRNEMFSRYALRLPYRRAFTLIELLVVIGIIAILAGILFPVFAQVREKARQTACLSNHKQIGTAMLMYAQDYDEMFVPQYVALKDATGVSRYPFWPRLLQPYIKNGNVFREPSNWARTPYEAQDFPDAWKSIIADQWGEGARAAMGRNACVPTIGFPMSYVTAPADSIAMCDAQWHFPLATDNAKDFTDYGYFTVWWRIPRQKDPLCPTGSDAGARNYALPAIWHSDGANVTFFDGHAKWYKFSTLTDLPAQYQSNPLQWRLWFALN